MKKLFIILFVLIIVAGLLWMFVFKNGGLNIIDTDNTETEQDVSDDDQNNNIAPPIALETAQNNELYTAAVAEKDSSKCEDINKEDTKDRCFSRIAIETNQTDICQKVISSSAKQSCLDDVTYQRAISTDDISLCPTINEEFWKESCFIKILEDKGSAGLSFCETLTDLDRQQCETVFYYKQAIANNECQSLENEDLKQECEQAQIEYIPAPIIEEEEIVEIDSDNDGLSDNDEVNIYNTDPNNADTDGDGYSDGEEVGNGYDPLS